METVHKAHMGVTGAIAVAAVAGGAFLWSQTPEKGPQWPKLDAATATKIVTDVAAVIPDHKFTVYCADASCVKIAKSLVKAAKAAKLDVTSETQMWGADNLFIGAPNEADAQKMANALTAAAGGALKVDHIAAPQSGYYVAFGRITATE